MLLNGKILAKKIHAQIRRELKGEPCLYMIRVGNNPSSVIYMKKKQEACKEVGIDSKIKVFEKVTQKKLVNYIKKLNENKKVHGILVQLPLPDHFNEREILDSIDSRKDVDGLGTRNLGLLFSGSGMVPCTPAGVIELLEWYKIPLKGKHAVIINRSNLVGKPLAFLLLKKDCTVTICHSKTKNLSGHTKKADILITAVGKAGFIKSNMVKKNSVVIDIGTSRSNNGKVAGDVDPEVRKKVKAITPVPGGVGPMTVAMLLKNTVKAYNNQEGLKSK